MPQDLAALTRAAEERERARLAGEPVRAAGDALYAARGNPRSPQAQALAERAGKVLGVPPMLVDADAEAEAEMRANMDALSSAHRTAGWISTPENAAVAHDQVRSLTGIEALLTGLGNIQRAQRQVGVDLTRRAGAGVFEVIGGGAYGLGLTGERVLDRIGLSDPARAQAAGALGPLQIADFLKDVGQRNRNAARYLRGEAGAERALSSWAPDVLPDIGYNMGFAGDVAEGVGQIGGQVLVAVGSGGLASLPTLYGQGVTQMDDRVRADQKKDGRTEYSAADDLALGAGGLVTALSEKLGLDAVMGALPAPVRARLTNKLVDIGVAGFTEGASEVAEGVGQNAIAMTLLGEDTGLLDGELAYQGGVGATVGALARSLVMTAVPGRQHIASTEAADRALKSHEEFNAAADAVLQNPMRSYAPERFADFLKSAADPDAEVVIPAEAVATFFQSNPDLDAWMDEWDIRAQVEEAMTAGTDVVMDQATYLAKVAGTAADTAWRQDIRFGLGEMSQREAEAFRTDGGEAQLSAAVDTALEQAATQEAQAAPERQVRDALFSQLREAGYTVDAANTQATLAARSFARRAERNPNRFPDAMAAFEDAGLTVRQEFPEVLRRSMDRVDVMIEALRQGRARPSESRMFGRSMMEFLAQRGGVVDSGGELAAMNVEAWHRPSQGGKAFRRRFVRQDAAGSNDFAPDQAARAAVEAGYLPEGATADDLFAAVQAEMSGRPVYSQQFDADLQAGENAAALDELERLMGDLGLDPATSDNATIKAALERAAASDFPGDANYAPDAAYNQDGRLNTDSEAFKAWFGDSKVVDENGDPLVVYHGTPVDFEAFDQDRVGGRWDVSFGFHFSDRAAEASLYAGSELGATDGQILPVYLKVENPLEIETGLEAWRKADEDRGEIIRSVVESRRAAARDDPEARRAADAALFEGLGLEAPPRNYDPLKAYDGVIIRGRDGMNVIAFDPTQIKSVHNRGTFDPADPRILYQPDTPYTGPRGQIRFSQGKAAITLFGSRDMSTFFHEFGHLTLETLIDDAMDPNASPEVKADLDVVLAWFSEQAGKPITANDVGVDQHELWARGTERYLMEGKAPSLELRDVFRTVAAWLKRIYATVLNLNAPISDDVRAVMDRLLASDEEIAQARETSGSEMGVEAFRQAGATEAEAAAYEAAVARARTDAEDDLLGRVMRAIKRQRTKEWNERADQIRPEITERVDAMPDMAAIEFITTSRTPLDRETVVAMLGDEAGLALLPKRVPPIVAAMGGQHPDMVAEAAGYPSGQAMLNGLMEYEAEKRALVASGDKRSVRRARIEDRVREALLDQYGDPLNDGSIEEEALSAIHSERYGDVLALDLNLLARKAGERPAPIDALRAWARERVGGRPVRDAKPGRYLRAERQASIATQAALAKGDRAEAFRQKQAQTINNVLYVAASQAERFADAAIGRMQRLSRGRNPSIHVDYMEQIDALLERFEIKAVSGRTVQRRQSLAAFIKAREEAGEPINIPAEVIEAAQKTNLADLTVDELRGLDETIKNLVHLGRMKNDLIIKGERRDLDKVADAAWASAQNLPDVRSNEAPGDKSAWENITGWGANFEASLVKAQEYFRLLDGGDIEGTFSTVLDQPGQAAADQRVKLQDEFWSPVIAAKNAVPNKVQEAWSDTLEDHPFINPNTGQPLKSMKRRDLVGAALHVGTLSNFEKMAKGYGLVSKEADAMAVSAARQGFIGWLNERLDPSEWAYVQAIWDAHERLRPTYFAVARKVEGFEPDAVEAEVVNTPAGPLKGGYAPIAYHASYDANAQRREQRDASDMFGGIMAAGPRPDNGATNARTNYVGAVRLGLDDARYLAETHITYAAYAEYVTNALKFLRHPLVAQAVKSKLGEAAYRTMEPWVAGQVRDEAITDPGANPILKLARGVRSNMTAAVLMGSVTVLMAQPGGLAQSSIEIGPKWMAKGIANATGLLFTDNLRRFVTGRSEFMRLRVEQGDLDRDFRLAMQNAKAGRGAGGKVQALKQARDNALVFSGKAIALVDFYLVSAPTWLGAYDKAMSEGRDEAAALYAADLAVRKTQGGGRAIDQAGVQRQNEVTKMMTFAYGWANAYYNMQRAAVVDLKNGQDRFENAVKLTALLVLPAIADAFLSGDWPEPGEDAQESIRNVAAWFARNVFFGAAAGVPVLRDFAGVAERKAEGKYAGAVGQTPLGRLGDSIIKLGDDAWDLAFDPEHEVSRRWPAHVIQSVGLALGVPGTTQATRVVNYGTDVADGEQNPDSVTDWMNGLLRGPQDDQR